MLHNPEFKVLLRPIIRDYRRRSYEYWRSRVGADSIAFGGCTADGNQYQVQIQAFWDNEPDENIRACFAIDDGHVTSVQCPYCEDFIISPNGKFVGE